MTPLDTDATGFVTLGKWNDKKDALDLIAIQIPYGYTLIIDKDCIHGDATLNGMFMMCMTSNHITMQTANSVFLKHPSTMKNITLDVAPLPVVHEGVKQPAPLPYVLYKNSTEEERKKLMAKMGKWDLIFNPFSQGYWKLSMTNIPRSTQLQLIGGVALALGVTGTAISVSLPLTIAALAAIIAVCAVACAFGFSFFAAGNTLKIKNNRQNNALPMHQCMTV